MTLHIKKKQIARLNSTIYYLKHVTIPFLPFQWIGCSPCTQEVEGSTPTGGICPNDFFFRSNRPGYPHPVSSELENSGIRVVVGDCSVTERRRWRPPYQTGKTVHVHAKHYKHNEDGRTAPGVCGNGSVPLSHSGNVVTRIGIHTHTHLPFHVAFSILIGVELIRFIFVKEINETKFVMKVIQILSAYIIIGCRTQT